MKFGGEKYKRALLLPLYYYLTSEIFFFFLEVYLTCLVVQGIIIHLPMQGTGVRSLSGKIPHAVEELSPGAITHEPVL